MSEPYETVPSRLSDLADGPTHGKASARDTGDGASDPSVLVLGSPAVPMPVDASLGSSRRAFLARASTLSLALPGIGAALAACSPSAPAGRGDSAGSRGAADGGTDGSAQDSLRHHNSDSKLDTAVVKGRHGNSSATPGATAGAGDVQFHRVDPTLPPLSAERTLRLNWRAMEAPVRIRPDTVVAAWTFEGDIPGPIVHCRVGDTIEFTLTNEGVVPHSMHFHAAQIDPKVAFRSVVKGQSVSYKMLSTLPDYTAFNGRPNQYIDQSIHVKVGDRVRFWVVNCGPTHPCAYHVVGEQFDTMYLGAPPGTPIRGVQTWDVPAGGGMCFELVCDIPGEFPFVEPRVRPRAEGRHRLPRRGTVKTTSEQP